MLLLAPFLNKAFILQFLTACANSLFIWLICSLEIVLEHIKGSKIAEAQPKSDLEESKDDGEITENSLRLSPGDQDSSPVYITQQIYDAVSVASSEEKTLFELNVNNVQHQLVRSASIGLIAAGAVGFNGATLAESSVIGLSVIVTDKTAENISQHKLSSDEKIKAKYKDNDEPFD